MRKLTLLFVGAVLLTVSPLQAQKDSSALTLGGYIGLNFNIHSPNFPIFFPQSYTGLQSSGKIESGNTALGLNLGGLVEYKLNQSFGLSGRLGFNGASGQLSGNGYYPTTSGNINTKQTIDASLSYLDITPLAQWYNPFSVNNLLLHAGFNVGIPLSSSYTQTEQITDVGKVFPDNTNNRTIIPNGDIPSASMRLALRLGAGYNFRLNDKTLLTPELAISYPLGKVSGDQSFDSWSVPQIRLGIALKFDMSSKNTVTKNNQDDTYRAEVEVGAYDDNGGYSRLNILRVEDLQYSEMYPLIPYIFFDENSAELKSKYQIAAPVKGESGDASAENLPQDAVEINRNTLNIVIARLRKFPQAKLTLTGTNDGKKEKREISQQRAEIVRNYLVNSGISEDRLTIQSRDLPEKPSAKTLADGDAENRRVEFTGTVPEVMEPVMIQKDRQRIAQPNLVEFRPKITSETPIREWTLTLTQAGKQLRQFTENGETMPKRWLIRPDELSGSQLPIEYNLRVADSAGNVHDLNGTLPVDYISNTRKNVEKLPDRTIEKFSLILFDFDKAEMTAENMRILEKTVVPAIKFNSVVKITGYTDRTGDAKYNKELSLRRANAVKDLLSKKTPTARYEAKGLGKDVMLFDNDAQTGRQLSRTVQIVIETPTK